MSLTFTSITNIPKATNLLTINLITLEKVLNYHWISKNKQHVSLYQKIEDKVLIRGLLTYTSFGTYCLFLISLYELINQRKVSPKILNYSWSILFSVTSGYYLYVIPGIIKSNDPKSWFLNIWCHGPYLLINTLKLYLIYPHCIYLDYFEELKYCFLFSYSWLGLIWLPWYKYTGDFMYPPLNSKYSLQKRIGNIFKMSLLMSIGITGKHIVYNKLIKEK